MATDQRDISHRLDSLFLIDPSQPGDPTAVAPPGSCIQSGLQLCLKTATLPASIDHHQASSIPPTTRWEQHLAVPQCTFSATFHPRQQTT